MTKQTEEKLFKKALKSVGLGLTFTTLLISCAKDLPDKESDSIKTDVYQFSEVGNAKIVVETVSKNNSYQGIEGIEAKSTTSGISALNSTTHFDVKVVSSTNDRLNSFLKDMQIEADSEGQQYEITFKISDGYLVAYASPLTTKNGLFSLNSQDVMPEAAKQMKSLPLFQYSIADFGIKEKIKNDLDEETRNIKFTATNREDATHFRLSPITKNRVMTGLQGLSDEERKQIFKKNRIESEIWSVKRARKLLQDQNSLKVSYDGGKYEYSGDELLRIAVFGDELIVKRAITKGELTHSEQELLNEGKVNKYISVCDEAFARELENELNNCFLRSEFSKSISHIKLKYDVDQQDGTILAKLKTEVTKNRDNTNLIKVDDQSKVSEVNIKKEIDNTFERSSIENEYVIVEATSTVDDYSFEREGVESDSSALSALRKTKVFNTKVVEASNKRLTNQLTNLNLVAANKGDKFKVTFKLTNSKLVGFIEAIDGAELITSHLPSEYSQSKKVPAFELDIEKYVNERVVGKDEISGENIYHYEEVDADLAKHIQVGGATLAGITDSGAQSVQGLFSRDSLERELFSVNRLKSLFKATGDELTISQVNNKKFDEKDGFRTRIFDGKIIASRYISANELSEVEKQILKSGSVNKFISKCSFKDQQELDQLNKALKRDKSSSFTKNNCYLRAEYETDIQFAELIQNKDERTGKLIASTSISTENVDIDRANFVIIGERLDVDSTTLDPSELTNRAWIKLSEYKNKEYMMRRVLEDSPNVFDFTYAGSKDSWHVEIVKFQFDSDTVYIKRSQPLLGRTGTTDVDDEVIMSFPVEYKREINFDSQGNRLAVTRYEDSTHLDEQAVAIVNLSENKSPRVQSAIGAFGLEKYLGRKIEEKAIDIVQEVEGEKDLLNYTIASKYATSDLLLSLSGYGWLPQTHEQLEFKERVSFKRYYGTEENPIDPIPYDIQKKLNYGIFTADKTVPKGYTEQTDTFDTEIPLPMIFDIRNGKQITYVLAGIPANKSKTETQPQRVLTAAEKDLRKKIISSSKEVIKDLNDGFKQAFKGTEFEGRSEVLKLKIERDESMPAGVKVFEGLEVVEPGHIGDINRNHIYWVEKGTSSRVLGLGGPSFNPRNGFVESASVYLYGGNMKGSIDYMVEKEKSELEHQKNMKVPTGLIVNKDPAPADAVTPTDADDPSVDEDQITDADGDTSNDDSSENEAEKKRKQAARINYLILKSLDSNAFSRNLPSDRTDLMNIFKPSPGNSEQMLQEGIEQALEISKKVIDNKPDLRSTILADIDPESDLYTRLDPKVRLKEAFNHVDNPVAFAEALYGKNSIQALNEQVLNRMEWMTSPSGKKVKSPSCVHMKPDLVLSKIARKYNIIEKASTPEGKNDILIDMWKPTLAHEIGHNLGLRHNFIGSFDKKNWKFHDKSDQDSIRTSSSVMDYQTDDHMTYDGLGPYDVYALRAAYAGYVELEGLSDQKRDSISIKGNEVKVRSVEHDTAEGKKYTLIVKSIDLLNAMGEENYNNITRQDILDAGIKRISFCSDEEAGQSPQCNRHDKGTTFTEIVENEIEDYRNSYNYGYFITDKKYMSTAGPYGWLVRKFSKLRQVNEELWYQFIFESENHGDNWQNVVQDMIGAAELSLNFLRSVIAMPEVPSYVNAKNKNERYIPAVVEKVIPPPFPGLPSSTEQRLAMIETKWTDGKRFDPENGRASIRGTEEDKLAAIIALTADRSKSWRYLRHSLRIPYTLLEKFIFRRDSDDSLVLQTLQEVLLDDVTPRSLVNLNQGKDGAGDYVLAELDKNVFKTEVTEWVRNYAIYGSMLFLNIDSFEPSFNPSRAFRVENKDEEELKVINEQGSIEAYIQQVRGDKVFVPYASDSFKSREMILKGDVLRPVKKLQELYSEKFEILPQIGPFLENNIGPSQEFDAEMLAKATEELQKAVAAGDFNAIVRGYQAVGSLHKNRIANADNPEAGVTPEQLAAAEEFVENLTVENFGADLYKARFTKILVENGLNPNAISQQDLEKVSKNYAASKMVPAQKCIAKRDECNATQLNTIQGLKEQRVEGMLRSMVKTELDQLSQPKLTEGGSIDLLALFQSAVLVNMNFETEFGSKELNAYKPTVGPEDSHDRILGNVTELSRIFYLVNPQENN